MAANTSVSVDNEVPIKHDKFVCIEYPGRVENVDRMLETLGDEENISKTISETNKRIELRFRPDDPYCKPVCGSLYPTNNLLVRVKRRYRKPKSSQAGKEGNEDKDQARAEASTSGVAEGEGPSEDTHQDVEYKSEILGVVESTYRFTGMCDFQYLAMHKNKDGEMESLIEKIIPSNLLSTDYFDQEMPYHLQPPSFSRSDIPTDYHYKPEQIQHRPSYPAVTAETLESNLIGRNRARRPHNTFILAYDKGSIPAEPHPNAWKTLDRYKNFQDKLKELKSLFEKRPLWSKNALKCNIELTDHQFKVLLPVVAYYFITGPWRALWCKLDYDPRKEVNGKQYQMLDFRLRKVMVDVYGKGVIRAKRSTYMYRLPITVRKPCAPQGVTVGSKTEEQEDHRIVQDAYYIFRRGLVPAYHQMFYQLCDLHVDELQSLIHSNDGREPPCDERNGWLEPDVLGKLRDLITEILKETFLSIRKQTGNSGNTDDQPSTSQATGDKDDAGDEDDDDDDDDDGDPMGQDVGGDEDDNDEQDDDNDINEMEMEMLGMEMLGMEMDTGDMEIDPGDTEIDTGGTEIDTGDTEIDTGDTEIDTGGT